jgi:hypothetical protein
VSLEGGIGGLPDELPQAIQALLIEGRSLAAAVWPGSEGAGPAAELEEPGDGRGIDAEADGELAAGAFAATDGGQDAFAEVVRQGLYESPPVLHPALKSCATRT